MWRREESEKILTFLAVLVCLIAAKIFGKPLLFRLNFPQDDRTDTMHLGGNRRGAPLVQSLALLTIILTKTSWIFNIIALRAIKTEKHRNSS